VGDPAKLVGSDALTPTASLSKDYFLLFPYQAVASGTASKIRVRSGTVANIKVAIYSNSGGEPVALLSSGQSSMVIGTNDIAISDIQIITSEIYWFGYITDINAAVLLGSQPPVSRRYKAELFATFDFPSTPSGLTTSSTSSHPVISAWGTLASGGAGRLIGSGDPSMIHVGHPKMIHVANPSLIRARGG
jgi:hypothetical protein